MDEEELIELAKGMARTERIRQFAAESDRIEQLEPDERHVVALTGFLALPKLTVTDLREFVGAIEPKAKLRDRAGRNVSIVDRATGILLYRPPEGGQHIVGRLEELLEEVNRGDLSPAVAHAAYESLHPFTDGNGRSGRAIWAWHMQKVDIDPFGLPFLHRWYYQSLELVRRQWEGA
jgi:Fic/DOC family protein